MSQGHASVRRDPRAVQLHRPPAGFWIRALALLIDNLVMLPLAIAGNYGLTSSQSVEVVLAASIPGLIYKPFMECKYGATLGKMACGLRVVDRDGRRLGLGRAYVRFLPWLAAGAMNLLFAVWLVSHPQFQAVSGFRELGRFAGRHQLMLLLPRLAGLVIMIDCVTAAFADRKRAVHDMLAGSYCVRQADRPPAAG